MARTHQANFPLFLGVVIGLSVLIVVVFVATAPGDTTHPGEPPGS